MTALVNQLYGKGTKSAAMTGGTGETGGADTPRKGCSVEIKADRADKGLPLPGRIEVYINNATLAGEYSLLATPKAGNGFASILLQRAMEEAGLQYVGKPVGDVVGGVEGADAGGGEERGGRDVAVGGIKSLVVEVQDWDYTPAKSEDQFPVYSPGKKWPVAPK